MITLKTPLKEFIELCEQKGACSDAVPWMKSQLKNDPSVSVAKSVSIYLADKNLSETWAVWLLKNFKDLDVNIQNMYIKKIRTPMFALQLLLDCDFLTDEQDAVLKAKYEGKLPTAEKEIKSSIIITAKQAKLEIKQ